MKINSKASFDRIDLMLVTPKTQNNGSLRQSLSDLEFREMRMGSEMADIVQALDARAPDLLITDGDLPDGDVCELIGEIRHGKIGGDPFMPVIVTTWSPSNELVQRVVNCGADDLLVQPASRGQLGARVEALTFRRKPFVVTASYIGPDRRKEIRPGDNSARLIEVPNVLRAKAVGDESVIEVQRTIDRLRVEINHSKLKSNAEFVSRLIEYLVAGIADPAAGNSMSARLASLVTTAEDIVWRVGNTRFAHVAKLGRTLIQVARRIRSDGGKPSVTDIKLLPKLALSIRLAFEDSAEAAAAAEKISEVVSGGSMTAGGPPA
ncbi:MAG: response regulator [Alphaproteobacteria bacterium]|nr:response regulator [Alphaproteobacteria bacterium]